MGVDGLILQIIRNYLLSETMNGNLIEGWIRISQLIILKTNDEILKIIKQIRLVNSKLIVK